MSDAGSQANAWKTGIALRLRYDPMSIASAVSKHSTEMSETGIIVKGESPDWLVTAL